MHHDGVADERSYYKDTSSFMMATRTRAMPNHSWISEAQQARTDRRKVLVSGNVGILGYNAGRDVHIVDTNALTEPLLARLPVRHDPFWRIGHYARALPEGYVATLEAGECRMKDEKLCEFYEALREVVAGELWSWHRLGVIARLNFGSYDALIDQDRYRFPNRVELRLDDVARAVPETSPWNTRGMRVLNNSGLIVQLGHLTTGVQGLQASFDGNDSYRIEFRRGSHTTYQFDSSSLELSGTHTRSIHLPAEAAHEGFDSVFILPTGGDGSYSVGFLRLML